MPRRPAIKRSQEQWKTIIEEQKQSGETVQAYCLQRQLNTSTFYAWKNKLSTDTSKPVTSSPNNAQDNWLPINLPSVASCAEENWTLELTLPGGITLKMKS